MKWQPEPIICTILYLLNTMLQGGPICLLAKRKEAIVQTTSGRLHEQKVE